MSSLPVYSMLGMPELDPSSSDSSPSSGISSVEQLDLSPNTYHHPVYIPPSYPVHYGYLSPPPATYTPNFGYSLPISPGYINNTAHDPSHQGYQAYNYGYNCNYPLPTIPPRFSATAPIGVPGSGRITGCVSPLDLFGNMPKQRSLPADGWTMGIGGIANSLTSTPGLDIPVDMDEPTGSTSSSRDNDPGSPTPSSSESAICIDEAEDEDEIEVEVEKELKAEVKQEAKKQKKLLPAGGKIPLSPAMKSKEEAVVGENREGKKRSRSAQACERCRVRKARCFGGHPCNRCIKRKFTCEFTPVKAKATIRPEPAKPKIRRHSMHTVASSAAIDTTVPPSDVRPAHLRAISHAHSRSVTIPTFSPHPYSRARPTAPAVPVHTAPVVIPETAPPSSYVGLGLGLTLGLQLTPPPDDLEGEDDDVPDMSTSSISSRSDPQIPGLTSSWTSSTDPLTNRTHAPSMIAEDDIFHFSPVHIASSFNEWDSGMDFDSFGSNLAGIEHQDMSMGQSGHLMYGSTSDWGGQPMMFTA